MKEHPFLEDSSISPARPSGRKSMKMIHVRVKKTSEWWQHCAALNFSKHTARTAQ